MSSTITTGDIILGSGVNIQGTNNGDIFFYTNSGTSTPNSVGSTTFTEIKKIKCILRCNGCKAKIAKYYGYTSLVNATCKKCHLTEKLTR